MSHILIITHGSPINIMHVQRKNTCAYCKSLPRGVRGPTIMFNNANYQINVIDRKICEYHTIIQWLKQHPEVKHDTHGNFL